MVHGSPNEITYEHMQSDVVATRAKGTDEPTSRVPNGARLSAVGGAPAQERNLRPQGRETLRRLLEAAIVVFDERGYHGARIDDIVRGAKTSHGTFYLYFASKEDLFRALLADVGQEMTALSDSLPTIAPSPEGYAALRAWLARFFELYDHYHPVIRAWMETGSGGSIDVRSIGAGVLSGFLRNLVERVREVDPPAVQDAGTAALAMVAMVERFGFYAVNQVQPLDRDATLDTLATILHKGLFGG
jgi:AcrR family transcriptional regulator